MSAPEEVTEASRRFYAALDRMLSGNAGTMAEVWSHASDVSVMHPIGGRQVGWDEVRASFEGVAKLGSGGSVAMRDQRIVAGEDLAYEVGLEVGHGVLAGQRVPIDQRVTNVYRREGGAWKMVHHHADVAPAMLKLLERLGRT